MHPKLQRVRAVIFDLSGTVIDYGSRGPVVAFVELFRRHGVELTEEQARAPMGADKRDHIRALLENPEIAARWQDVHHQAPGESVLSALYQEFIPLQIELLEHHCEVLPGVAELTLALRGRGIRFSSTTGFSSEMTRNLIPTIQANGFQPDLFVTPDMVGEGRPAPWMAFHAARYMNVYPMSSIVKVGDTPADIAEAQNAQIWAVAVSVTGNEIGLSREQLDSLHPTLRADRVEAARQKFLRLGAHYVIDAAADLLPVIDQIDARLAAGERP